MYVAKLALQAKYLRTYHPDVDISFELIQDELDLDDSIAKSRASFDPYQGNALSAISYFQNDKRKRGFLLAFPTGDVGRDLSTLLHLIALIAYAVSHTPFRHFTSAIKELLTCVSTKITAN